MMEAGKVPENFGYTIPLLKVNNARMSKSSTVNDFRGISISPVVSKIFENDFDLIQGLLHYVR
jgi:hypothetical protein